MAGVKQAFNADTGNAYNIPSAKAFQIQDNTESIDSSGRWLRPTGLLVGFNAPIPNHDAGFVTTGPKTRWVPKFVFGFLLDAANPPPKMVRVRISSFELLKGVPDGSSHMSHSSFQGLLIRSLGQKMKWPGTRNTGFRNRTFSFGEKAGPRFKVVFSGNYIPITELIDPGSVREKLLDPLIGYCERK